MARKSSDPEITVIVANEAWRLPVGLESDGCTSLRWLGPIDRLMRWAMKLDHPLLRRYCYLHDFLCRYGVVDAEAAHIRLRWGARVSVGKARAFLIYWAVRLNPACQKYTLAWPPHWSSAYRRPVLIAGKPSGRGF